MLICKSHFFKKIIVIIFSFVFCMCHAFASEDVVLNRYGYGLRKWNESLNKYDKAMVSDHGGIYYHYNISDSKSKLEQSKRGIYVHLEVRQEGSNVIAEVNFYNRSHHSYFIFKNNIGLSNGDGFYPLCDDAFMVTTEGIRLDYLGMFCAFDSNQYIDEKINWLEIPAGNAYSFTINLNDVYNFLPEKRRYNIGSLEYIIVNNDWFTEQLIYGYYGTLFSILDWQYMCKVNEGGNYIEKRWLCESDAARDDKSAQSFLRRFDYDGLDRGNYFKIRTNQVVIDVDGDKTFPPKPENIRFSYYE